MKDTEKKKMTRSGFTLVELVVVIVILGVLAGVAYPAYTGYIKKANDAKVQVELNEILLAAEASCADYGIDINGNVKDGEGADKGPNGIMFSFANQTVALKCFQYGAFEAVDASDKSKGRKLDVGGTDVTNIQLQQSMVTYGDGQFMTFADKLKEKPNTADYSGYGIAGIKASEFPALFGNLENTSYKGAKWFAWSPWTGWYTDTTMPEGYTYITGQEYWVNNRTTPAA